MAIISKISLNGQNTYDVYDATARAHINNSGMGSNGPHSAQFNAKQDKFITVTINSTQVEKSSEHPMYNSSTGEYTYTECEYLIALNSTQVIAINNSSSNYDTMSLSFDSGVSTWLSTLGTGYYLLQEINGSDKTFIHHGKDDNSYEFASTFAYNASAQKATIKITNLATGAATSYFKDIKVPNAFEAVSDYSNNSGAAWFTGDAYFNGSTIFEGPIVQINSPMAATNDTFLFGSIGIFNDTDFAQDLGIRFSNTQIEGSLNVTSNGSIYRNGISIFNGTGAEINPAILPSYVDDVIEGYYYSNKFYEDAAHSTEITGESGKIYVDITIDSSTGLPKNVSYRWGGSSYAAIISGGDYVTVGTTQTITGSKTFNGSHFLNNGSYLTLNSSSTLFASSYSNIIANSGSNLKVYGAANFYNKSTSDMNIALSGLKTINNVSVIGSGNIEVGGSLPSNVAYLDQAQTFTAAQTFSAATNVTGALTVSNNATFDGPIVINNNAEFTSIKQMSFDNISALTFTDATITLNNTSLTGLSGYVTTTGEENISGVKTFTATPNFCNKNTSQMHITVNYSDIINKPTIPTIPSNLAYTDATNTFTASQNFSGGANFYGKTPTNLNITLPSTILYSGNNIGLLNNNMGYLNSTTLTTNMPANVAYLNKAQTFVANQTFNAAMILNNNSTFNGLSAITISNTPITLSNSSVTGLNIAIANVTSLQSTLNSINSSIPTNHVTTNTSQSISGAKTFTGTVNMYGKTTSAMNIALPSNVAYTDAANTFTAEQTLSGGLNVTGALTISNNTTFTGINSVAFNNTALTGTMNVTSTTISGLATSLNVSSCNSSVGTITYGVSGYKSGTMTFSRTGYYPIGVVGHRITANTGTTYLFLNRLEITSAASGSATISYTIKNTMASSNATQVYLNCSVLWAKV